VKYGTKYSVGMKSFSTAPEYAQDKTTRDQEFRGQVADPDLPGKWPLKSVHLYVLLLTYR